MALDIPAKFKGKTEYWATGGQILFRGEIDQTDPSEFLGPFFKTILAQAVESGLDAVEIDIRQLGFINSSGVKAFVVFLVGLLSLPTEKRFLVNFAINKEVTWHNAVVAPLRIMAPNFVRVN